MNKRIMILGKFTIRKEYWKVIKEMVGLQDEDVRFTIYNKPEAFILSKENITDDCVMVITTESNPRQLKRLLSVTQNCNIPLVKPFKNNQQITHLMKLDDVIIEYKYTLYKLDKVYEDKKPYKKKYHKKEKPEVKEMTQEEKDKRLDEMLKNLETPVMEKPRKKKK